MKGSVRAFVAVVCVAGAVAATASAWLTAGRVRIEDRNHDGRPDRWRFYDAQGQLARVATDTNFDGRSDQQDYYDHGVLSRRERDRNFDDRADIVESFDLSSHEEVRSIVDVDFDGTADLLVLFSGGRPVFSKWAHPVTSGPTLHSVASTSVVDGQLAPLADPFSRDRSISAARSLAGFGNGVWLSTSGGLPTPCFDITIPLASTDVSDSGVSPASFASLVFPAPRGPPASHLLS